MNPREALSLQGQIGNHAVANLLDGRPRTPPPLMRSAVPLAGDPVLSRALADCARARRVAREEEGESADESLIPGLMDAIQSAVSSIPGYTVLTAIIGKDPLTDEPARVSREELVEQLLAYGPFAAAVGPVLSAVEVIDDVIALVTDGLAAHNLTVARIERDIGAAWDEVSVLEGIDGNVAIVQRYVDAVLADVGAFVESIVDRVIELVREAAADVAEPLLATPEIEPIWSLAKKVLHYDP
ncbi:MAG TPA: hypothetical protein VFG79_19860, partial [Solirubrobacter sp.]|nr:hypothetical protein [Solirubrobacter sp.]